MASQRALSGPKQKGLCFGHLFRPSDSPPAPRPYRRGFVSSIRQRAPTPPAPLAQPRCAPAARINCSAAPSSAPHSPQLRPQDLSVGVAAAQDDLGKMGRGARPTPLPVLGRPGPLQDSNHHCDDHRHQDAQGDGEAALGFLGEVAAGLLPGHGGTESVLGHGGHCRVSQAGQEGWRELPLRKLHLPLYLSLAFSRLPCPPQPLPQRSLAGQTNGDLKDFKRLEPGESHQNQENALARGMEKRRPTA